MNIFTAILLFLVAFLKFVLSGIKVKRFLINPCDLAIYWEVLLVLALQLGVVRQDIAIAMDGSVEGNGLSAPVAPPQASNPPAPLALAQTGYAPVGALLQYLPKFDGKNMTLQDWIERVRSAVRMCNLTPELRAEIALSALEGDVRRTVMVRPESERDTLDKIFALLELAQGGRAKVTQLRSRFFNRPQKEGETLMQYSTALQEILNEVRRRDPEAMGAFQEVDRLLRDQFTAGLANKFLQDKLQEMTRMTTGLSFYQVYLAAIEREDELSPAVVKAVNSAQGAGGQPGPEESGTLKDVIQALRAEVRDLRLEVSRMKAEPSQTVGTAQAPPIALRRAARGRWSNERGPRGPCWICRQYGHLARDCNLKPASEMSPPALNYRLPQ